MTKQKKKKQPRRTNVRAKDLRIRVVGVRREPMGIDKMVQALIGLAENMSPVERRALEEKTKKRKRAS
jgi:hypothetical protein